MIFTGLEAETENNWTIQVIYPDATTSTLLSDKDIVLTLDPSQDKVLEQVSEINSELPEVDSIVKDEQIVSILSEEQTTDTQEKVTGEFTCPTCWKTYNAKRNLQRHLRMECGKDPQYGCFAGHEQYRRQYSVAQRQQRPAPIKQHSAPLYDYNARNIEVLGLRRPQIAAQGNPNFQRKVQPATRMIKPQNERIAITHLPKTSPQNPVQQRKIQPVQIVRRSAEPQVNLERPSEPESFKPIEPTRPTEFRRAWSVESEAPAAPEPKRQQPVVIQFKKPAEMKSVRMVEDHSRTKPANLPKRSPMKGSGLLTDSLSVIFTRRNNQQWKPAQNRGIYEEQPSDTSELDKQLDAEVSDTESACVDCPAPPRISQPTPQPTPDISTEDWFTTKQRILGNVKIDKDICEPMKVPTAATCPDSKNIMVDPHGFDIEPPTHLNKNVSPYIPSLSYERDEYEKYKTDKFKKEITMALLHQRYQAAKQAQKEKENQAREQHFEDAKACREYDSGNLAEQSYEDDQDDQDLEKYHIEKEAFNIQTTDNQPQYEYQQETYNDPNYKNLTEQYENEQAGYYGHQYENQNYEHQQNYAEDNYQYQQGSEEIVAPEAPQISMDHQQTDADNMQDAQYYQAETYQEYVKYDETNTFKEPQPVNSSNQTMCHKCSFQTTNPKKLKDHLKFVHGEVVSGEPTSHAGDLYFRREPKLADGQTDLFSRRGDFPVGKKPAQKFKRRNTANLVHIISDVVVPPSAEEPMEKDAGTESSGSKAEEGGVTAAMEYFESNKDQPKKPRPYRRDSDKMDKDWI